MTKLIAVCRDDAKDWKMINKMFFETKNKGYNESADIEKTTILVNLVFDNQRDIDNFMLQYKKDSKLLMR